MKLQSQFRTIRLDQVFELREYLPALLAKVKVKGSFEVALKQGSFLLQEYCSGQNYKQASLTVKSPLLLSSRPDGWEVSCFLPEGMTCREAPKPIGDVICFEERLAHQVAVMKVQGRSHYSSLIRKTEELRAWINQCQIQIASNSRIAIYRSPVLPFLRRNEIHFDAE